MKLKPIDQQVVVVFGASSGIGRETALQFAQRGAKVVVAARGEAGLASLVEEIQQAGGEARAVVADAQHFDQVQAVADQAVGWYDRLDTWVHAAAVALYATFEQTTPEEFKHVIEVNLTGQAYGAMAALPYLKRTGGGALIHISSIATKRALPYQSAYSASKHGIPGFLDALRLELQHEGSPISVTNIMPGSINTPFFSQARTKLGVQPKAVPPVYQPHLVAEAILYAAEYPIRDIFVGDAARIIALGQALSPQLSDAMLLRTAFDGQRTTQPKAADSLNAFFAPVADYDQVEGYAGHQAQSSSLYPRLHMHPVMTTLVGSIALGMLAGMTLRK